MYINIWLLNIHHVQIFVIFDSRLELALMSLNFFFVFSLIQKIQQLPKILILTSIK